MQYVLTQKRLTPELMCEDISGFTDKISQLCELLDMDLTELEIDHIAMRINDLDTTQAVHQVWMRQGQVISESLIHGRPIIVIELTQPLKLGQWQTKYLELPYPAEGKHYPVEGWEHVEFVIPSTALTADVFFAELCRKFPRMKDNAKKHHIQIKQSSPQAEGERLVNPTIAFKWNHVCIKLHPNSLKDVIASEQSLHE
ncbi:VOC family protein [Vibrio quintilis]|uniref:YecM protein n=1 Tax=Vibrio quintilis TaxID=1117707 RepID=A0A1M7YTE8_9VIBR|nr:VOC family protein [Vibrio quintilis]SHO55914.1 hypothetical protein VQ7734_01675 [Vibrio quintilis]